MTKKLTKNDSMRDSSQDFDTIAATFEAFLKQTNAHQIYFQEWEIGQRYKGTANVYYAWREWAKCIDHNAWVIDAFWWRGSKKGLDYWIEINLMWSNWLKQYINK